MRQAIQQSTDSVRAIAARYGVSPTTVQKWRRRDDADDRRRGPKMRDKKGMPPPVPQPFIMFRRLSLLPLDDCYYALTFSDPKLSRSTFHRHLQRYGLGSLAEIKGFHTGQALGRMPIGDFNISQRRARVKEGYVFVFTAIDRVSKITFAQQRSELTDNAAIAFVRELLEAHPFAYSAQTDRDEVFAGGAFSEACRAMGIVHRINAPLGLETSDPFDFETCEALEQAIDEQYGRYNRSCKLKVLGGRSPSEYVAFRLGNTRAIAIHSGL